ncbi:hypothetical protein CLAIMM_10652 [Cladophialophora immunda]|nr:hypothetical protein CLAIMM_10652 [Cladophialophora immunda]
MFTIHTDDRTLDFTFCDVDKAIIARNILLLSLIIDDIDGTRNSLHWNIYYHFRIDENSLHLLQNQARKLYALAVSLGTWHESKYGRLIKLCDHGSLEKVREMWKFYGFERKGNEISRFKEHLDACIRKSKST